MIFIQPWIPQFKRRMEIYLNDSRGQRSYITDLLLHSINPDLMIENSDQGPFVRLDIVYENHAYEFDFDVIEMDAYAMALGGNHLCTLDLDEDGLHFSGGIAPVYCR